MPAATVTPEKLRPYLAHGLPLAHKPGAEEAPGECPFCGREGGKFGVRVDTGQYHCFVCGADGNAYTFLRWLCEEGSRKDAGRELAGLAGERGLLGTAALVAWGGVVRSPLSGEWLVPGYNAAGALVQLYRYSPPPGNPRGKPTLLATPTLGHGLFGVPAFNPGPGKTDVYVCEGPWDGMALWEVFYRTKVVNEGRTADVHANEFALTAPGGPACLLATANVLAVPGANVWHPGWGTLLAGRRVYLLYDNDHPREVNGRQVPGAGVAGVRRTAALLAALPEPPAEIHYLCWGPEGYDPALPSGYDVRDLLTRG
jgi:hypothetical protein